MGKRRQIPVSLKCIPCPADNGPGFVRQGSLLYYKYKDGEKASFKNATPGSFSGIF